MAYTVTTRSGKGSNRDGLTREVAYLPDEVEQAFDAFIKQYQQKAPKLSRSVVLRCALVFYMQAIELYGMDYQYIPQLPLEKEKPPVDRRKKQNPHAG